MGIRETDDIGRAGEQIFDRWARAAGALSLQHVHDDIGVDRVFEKALPQSDNALLDAEPPCVQGWVQIKTTTKKRLSEYVKLDSCRRFVFSDSPVFFVRIRIERDEEPVEAYILHVDESWGGGVLEEIRRLASIGAATPETLHQHSFPVHWQSTHRVAPDGRAVIARLVELIGDPATYAARKKRWRESIGYDERPTRITIRASAAEMVHHLLGQTDSVTAKVTQATMSRFGITQALPDLIGPDRTITIGLRDGERALLRIRSDRRWTDIPGRFWTPIRVIQDLPAETQMWRFAGGVVEVVGEKTATHFRIALHEGRTATLGEWRLSSEAALLLAKGEVSVSLTIGDRAITLSHGKVKPRPRIAPVVANVTVAAKLAVEANLPESIELTSGALLAHHHERRAFLSALHDSKFGVELPIHTPALLDPKARTMPIMFTGVYWAPLGEHHLVCAVTTAPTSWIVKGSRTPRICFRAPVAERTPTEVFGRPDAALAHVESLAADARERHGMEGVIHAVYAGHTELERLGASPTPSGPDHAS